MGPQWPHLDFNSFLIKMLSANQLEGGLSSLELRILCVSPWVSDSPSCGKHVFYSRWWKIMFPQGGGKSEMEITFWAHPLFLDPPGPLRGSFQRHPQITPICILKLPFELLSSWVFPGPARWMERKTWIFVLLRAPEMEVGVGCLAVVG